MFVCLLITTKANFISGYIMQKKKFLQLAVLCIFLITPAQPAERLISLCLVLTTLTKITSDLKNS